MIHPRVGNKAQADSRPFTLIVSDCMCEQANHLPPHGPLYPVAFYPDLGPTRFGKLVALQLWRPL